MTTEDIDPVNDVGWYRLTSTLHKVFKRSKVILDQCILPIGMNTEEASEANSKNLRKFKINCARKNTWKNGMHDVFFMFLDISNPVIQDTSITKRKRSNSKKVSKEILELLKAPKETVFEEGNSAIFSWTMLSMMLITNLSILVVVLFKMHCFFLHCFLPLCAVETHKKI